MPLVFAVILCVVAPLLQVYELAELVALKATLPPAQKVVLPMALIFTVGLGFTNIVTASEDEQPPEAALTV